MGHYIGFTQGLGFKLHKGGSTGDYIGFRFYGVGF